MPSLTLRDIPEELLDLLKQNATLNHRSMNSEIIARLEQSVHPKRMSVDDILTKARELRSGINVTLSTEEIQKAILENRL